MALSGFFPTKLQRSWFFRRSFSEVGLFNYSDYPKATSDKSKLFTKTTVMWYVYILKCSDNTYYVGCSSNLTERLSRHSSKQVSYTSSRLPVSLVHYSAFPDKTLHADLKST